MKRYWNIYEKIYDLENLKEAHKQARKDKQLYREVKMVNASEEYFLKKIQKLLKERKYHITEKDYSVSTIRDKTKTRELRKLKYYPHRIIQWAIMLQIEKYFMQVFTDFTCASVKWRWMTHVMELMDRYMRDKEWTAYCLKLDISKFYPNVNHRILKKLLRKKFKDKDLLNILDMIIDSFPWKRWLPIWSYLSQFLANFYLSYCDHWLKEVVRCKYVVRYMDDIVILWSNKKRLRYVFRRLKWYLDGCLNLKIKPNYQIFPTGKRWVDYVWYRYFYGYKLLRKSTARKFKKKALHLKEKQEMWICWNFREWCAMNSYIGRMYHCNSYRLFEKYVDPIIPSMNRYYYYEIGNKKKNKLKKYYKKLINKKYKSRK